MKTLLLLLLPFYVLSQTKHDEYDFFLEDKNVYWQRTYKAPGKSVEDLIIYFESSIISSIKTENLRVTENKMSFTVDDQRIVPRDFGKSWGNTAIFVQSWQRFLCVVDFKEGRYRITLTDVFFDNRQVGYASFSGTLSEFVTKKRGSEFSYNKTITESLWLLEQFYAKMFSPNKILKDNSDW
jgi:hypothetical protein